MGNRLGRGPPYQNRTTQRPIAPFTSSHSNIGYQSTPNTASPRATAGGSKCNRTSCTYQTDPISPRPHSTGMLAYPPQLQLPEYTRPFTLYTGWSGKAMGAVLTQPHRLYPRGEYIITYASKKLNPAERQFSMNEGECLAAQWAIRQFQRYLDGTSCPINLVTDRAAIRWLQENSSSNRKLIKCLQTLQQ